MGSAWWQCTACLRAQEEDICELQLNHCNLYDVPPDVFIYERTLEKLYLDANRIKDLPRPLFQCHELRVLSLSDNEISTLPPAIASLINLEHLDLSKNNIKELPDSIKECKNLRSIDISVNPFERFPDAITHIVGLKELYINDAYIEYLPANFGRLSSLQTLELRENNMMTLPKSMSRLVNLQRLDIGNNEFTELPEVVGELTNLTELWIDGNDIRRIPLNIEQLYRLNHFDCTLNSVHVVPTEIQGWRDVSIINFSSNEIYQLPDSICYLRTIVTLKIDDNQLNELPNDIGQMSSLEELIVTKNFLEYLPSSLGLLRRLHCLNADNNYLKCLPPEIGSCTALSLLSLQSNNLTRIPAELGHLSSLTVLNLVNNSIKFLPVSLLNLTHLKALWLSDNQSQPLVPLQQDFNTEEDMMVLSCFMLPQKPRQDLEKMVQSVDPSSGSIIGTGRRICFAADVETELPRQLHRAPTPYPKELRNLARHARNLHHQNAHDRKIHLEQETLIKEATVTKSTPTIATKSGTCLTSSIKSADHYSTKYEKEHSNSEESSDEANKTVLAKEKNPDIREAKYIRNPTTEYLNKSPTVSDYVNSTTWKSEEYSETNTAKIVESEKLVVEATLKNTSIDGSVIDGKTDMVPLSPPPYHIAAAFSKKAALFQHLNFDQPAESPSAFEEKSTFNTPNISKNNILLSNSRTVENEPITTDTNANEDNQSISKPARLANLPTLTVEPKEEDSKAEDIYETDNKSLKPSKIPVLRAKHSELNNLSINEKSITDYENSNNFNFEPKDLPTSPVTGRKYRSPITQNCFKKNSFKDANLEARNFHEKESNQVGSEKSEKIEKVLLDHRLQEDFGGNNNEGDNSSQILENRPRFKWMFGPHRNANVLPVQVRKNPGLGFSIAGGVAGAETGIIITKVNPDGPAQGTLRPGDKILEVDGIDFTKSDHDNAVAVLRATGTVVSMMISRHQ